MGVTMMRNLPMLPAVQVTNLAPTNAAAIAEQPGPGQAETAGDFSAKLSTAMEQADTAKNKLVSDEQAPAAARGTKPQAAVKTVKTDAAKEKPVAEPKTKSDEPSEATAKQAEDDQENSETATQAQLAAVPVMGLVWTQNEIVTPLDPASEAVVNVVGTMPDQQQATVVTQEQNQPLQRGTITGAENLSGSIPAAVQAEAASVGDTQTGVQSTVTENQNPKLDQAANLNEGQGSSNETEIPASGLAATRRQALPNSSPDSTEAEIPVSGLATVPAGKKQQALPTSSLDSEAPKLHPVYAKAQTEAENPNIVLSVKTTQQGADATTAPAETNPVQPGIEPEISAKSVKLDEQAAPAATLSSQMAAVAAETEKPVAQAANVDSTPETVTNARTEMQGRVKISPEERQTAELADKATAANAAVPQVVVDTALKRPPTDGSETESANQESLDSASVAASLETPVNDLPRNASEQKFNGELDKNPSQFGDEKFKSDSNFVGAVAASFDTALRVADPVAADATGTPEQHVDRYEVARQVLDGMQTTTDRLQTSQVIITLKPAHLGEVTVKINVDGDKVTAAFHAASAEVRSILEGSLPQFKQEMSQQGWNFDSEGVYSAMKDFMGKGQERQPQQFQQNLVQSPVKQKAQSYDDIVVGGTSPKPQTLTTSAVDYRI